MKRRPISQQRSELRWLLVHEAGCVDCLATHDDELLGELAREGRALGVRIPRSLRHLLATGALTPGERYTPRPPEPRRSGVLRLDAAAREAVELHRCERGEIFDVYAANGRTYTLTHRGELRRKTPRANRSRS